MATRSVGRVASARAGVRSAAEYESYGCVSKLESKVRSRSRKYITGTADDRRARIARVQYSMRHACSTMILGHANVPKTCTTNSGSATQAAVLLSIRRWDRAACLRRNLPAEAGSFRKARRRRRVDRITTAFRHPLFFAHISVSLYGKSWPSPTGFHTFFVVRTLITTCWVSSTCSKIGPAPLDPARSLAR